MQVLVSQGRTVAWVPRQQVSQGRRVEAQRRPAKVRRHSEGCHQHNDNNNNCEYNDSDDQHDDGFAMDSDYNGLTVEDNTSVG
jgi:hypothetical protein